jgi:hypothetical protein
MGHITTDCPSRAIALGAIFSFVFVWIEHSLGQEVEIGALQRQDTEIPIAQRAPTYFIVNNVAS